MQTYQYGIALQDDTIGCMIYENNEMISFKGFRIPSYGFFNHMILGKMGTNWNLHQETKDKAEKWGKEQVEILKTYRKANFIKE